KEGNPKYDYPLYKTIRENGGLENWEMVLIENYECHDKHELHSRERHFIEELKPTLNSRIPTRTREEHYEEHKEEIKASKRTQWNKNKEGINQNRRETLYECECGSKGLAGDLARHKRT